MKNYLITYFKVSGNFYLDDFLQDIPVNPDRIITYDGENFEIIFGRYDNFNGNLIDNFEATLSPLYDYLDKLIEWKNKGVTYKFEVETDLKNVQKLTIVPFKIAHFFHYTHAYNDDFPIW